MKSLLVFREKCRELYSRYEFIMTPGWKFLLSMMTLLVINKELAYMERICSMPIVLVAALFCSFMPTNFIVVVAALFVVLHVYALSLPAACVVVLLLLVLFLLYFRFSAKDTVAAAITPILWVWKIPYIAPIILRSPWNTGIGCFCRIRYNFVLCFKSH